jgi:hypothetical protein
LPNTPKTAQPGLGGNAYASAGIAAKRAAPAPRLSARRHLVLRVVRLSVLEVN